MRRLKGESGAVTLLILLQLACAVFFLSDVVVDYESITTVGFFQSHLWLELLASLSLFAAIFIEFRYLQTLLKRQKRLQQRLSTAGSAIEEIVESMFHEWGLSAAEHDVGVLLVKGLSISEIAHMRGNAEGTIKAHLNAIYRKSGTRNRAEVLSMVVDAVMGRDADMATAVEH